MKKLTTLVLSLIALYSLNAQDKYDPETIMNNSVREMEGYVFGENSQADSFLITKEYFNAKGRRTKIEIYDSTGLMRSEYIYIYKDDTLRTERITKFQGVLNSTTKISYDKKGREIKSVDYDKNGKKNGTYSKSKYIDRDQIKETKIYFKKRLSVHKRENYDPKGASDYYHVMKDGCWVQKRANETDSDLLIEEFENYEGTALKLIRKTMITTDHTVILGLKNYLKLAPKDILTTEKYINSNGLPEMEKEYFNQKLIATKKYKCASI